MKRSAQVALLLMGVGGVGAGAYAVSPARNDCVPQRNAPASAVAPNPTSALAANTPCPPRRTGTGSSTRGGYYRSWSNWSTPIYNRGSSTSTAGRSGSTGTSRSGGVARGGFGGTGHSASASG
ncbi:MAG: hypothetical protein ACREDY_05010 [Bradyrhizobium sp.]